ncbi:hypothetical protein BD413DRAFT_106520 [Trametes elegans]|nr:hypothetical protein BD413DRAFT_106520 [Trametes elegans]
MLPHTFPGDADGYSVCLPSMPTGTRMGHRRRIHRIPSLPQSERSICSGPDTELPKHTGFVHLPDDIPDSSSKRVQRLFKVCASRKRTAAAVVTGGVVFVSPAFSSAGRAVLSSVERCMVICVEYRLAKPSIKPLRLAPFMHRSSRTTQSLSFIVFSPLLHAKIFYLSTMAHSQLIDRWNTVLEEFTSAIGAEDTTQALEEFHDRFNVLLRETDEVDLDQNPDLGQVAAAVSVQLELLASVAVETQEKIEEVTRQLHADIAQIEIDLTSGALGGRLPNSVAAVNRGGPSRDVVQLENDQVLAQAENIGGNAGRALYESALAFVRQHRDDIAIPVNTGLVGNAYRALVTRAIPGQYNAHTVGWAAAIKALLERTPELERIGDASNLLGHAIGLASQMFSGMNQEGGLLLINGGTKQDALNAAAMVIMKLLLEAKRSNRATLSADYLIRLPVRLMLHGPDT